MPQAPGIARQCFSTDDFPTAEREAVWREVISRNIMRVDLSRPRDHPLYNRMECLELPGVTIVLGSGSPCTSARSTELLSDASDQVFFSFNKSGRSRARWLGKEEELAVGDAIIVPTAEAGQMEFPAAFQYVGLRMDRSMLATMVDGLEDVFMTLAPCHSPALHTLLGYIKLIERSGDEADRATQNLFSLHLQDLLALTIGANRDARHVATGRGVAAARMALIKADIIERLPLGPVRIGDLATRHAISEVYIRKLFSSDGTTLTDFVTEKRLAAVYRGLLNPLLESQSISQLAYAAGFSDLSHFNRRFRQRYGRTPSEVRGALRNCRT